jgi:OPT family small oligopeptide transporter
MGLRIVKSGRKPQMVDSSAQVDYEKEVRVTGREHDSNSISDVSFDDMTPIDDLKQRLSVWDPNMPVMEEKPLFDVESIEVKEAMMDEVEDSPYPEVRAAVHNYDEDMPANTIRAWTLGLILSAVGAAVNTIFSMRAPSIGISSLVAQLLTYPLGVGWAKVMPNRQFKTFGIKWNLNPGPFNVKEHTVIVVMANTSFGTAYATDIIIAQKAFYGQDFGIAFQLLLTISSQSLGYGLAGMMRRFLVTPASMIWPGNLVGTSLLYAMHEKNETMEPNVKWGTIGRYKWFFYIFCGAFVYYWLPGFLAQFLSVFAFATWIAPNNVIVNQIFGGTTGLSLLPITFDWTQIAGYVGSPLIPPWHAIANTMFGVVVFYVLTAMGIHYSGMWYSEFLPISDSGSYDNSGARYNVTRILTPEFTLDVAKYKAYSPLFLSTTFALSYGLSFATIVALVIHTYLYNGKDIMNRLRSSKNEPKDVHAKMMEKYPEAPDWWYGSLFVIMIAVALVAILAFPTELTWWAFGLSLIIAGGFSIPIGIIQAITNIQIGLNVITEFIFGYLQPGRPLALMMFKTYGYITMSQALSFVGDLKL